MAERIEVDLEVVETIIDWWRNDKDCDAHMDNAITELEAEVRNQVIHTLHPDIAAQIQRALDDPSLLRAVTRERHQRLEDKPKLSEEAQQILNGPNPPKFKRDPERIIPRLELDE
jgi:hypothetical protein